MSGEPLVTALETPVAAGRGPAVYSLLSDYWTLTKPEVNFLILITAGAGFYLGCRNAGKPVSLLALFNTLLGTFLVASGTATLNQYLERKFDAQMRRTGRRPAAAGRLEPDAVLLFGIVLSVAGSIYLAVTCGLLASLLALLTSISYLFLYTPLKRRTPLCVLIGAAPGAMPPLIGWAAAAGGLSIEAWLLYAIVFLWQLPHFMAIAWMYREDYDRAGYRMLPNGQARVVFVILQTILPLLALLLVDIMLFPTRHSNIFLYGRLLLGLGFLYCGLEFVHQQSRSAARRLLAASILYLPLLLMLRIASR